MVAIDSGNGTGYRGLLRNRRFVLAVGSQAIATGGYAVYNVSILLLSFRISGSLAVAGLVLLVEFGIYSITFIAGPTIDRSRNLRSILIVGYSLQALCALAIGITVAGGHLAIAELLGLVAAISIVWDFTWTAENSLVPRVVREAELFRASGISGAVSGGNSIAGYAAGAGLILLVGPVGGMYLYAALNAAAAIVVLPLSVPAVRRATTRFWDDFLEGWRELGRGIGKPFLQLAGYSSAQAFFTSAPALFITLLSQEKFANPSTSYGVLFTVFVVGGVAGSLILGHANPRRRITGIMVGGTAAQGILLIAAVVVAPALVPSAILWFLVGVVGVAFYDAYLVYLQAKVPKDRFGRVLTNLYIFRGVPIALGSATVGFLAASLGAPELALLVGIAYLLVAATGPVVLPGIRRLGF